jgi:PPP family 3-phenylpropionic acid transporter
MAAYYACLFLGVGVLATFLPLHLQSVGLSASGVAALFAARTFLQATVPPLWGAWADRQGDTRPALRLATLLSLLCFVPLLVVTDPVAVVALLVAQGLGWAALTTLADTMTLGTLGDRPERYGRVRVAGTVAYGVGVLALVLVLPAGDEALRNQVAAQWSVPALVATLALATLVTLWLPSVPRRRMEDLSSLRLLVRQPGLFPLLAAGGLHWAAHAPFLLFLGWHLRDLGHDPLVAGLTSVACVAIEVAVMLLGPRLVRARTLTTWLTVCFLAGLGRWVVSAVATSAWGFGLTQLAHGLSFGLFYIVMVEGIRERAPEESRGTAQGLFAGVTFGVGGILGLLVSGAAYDAGRGPAMFGASVVLEVLALGMLLAGRVLAAGRAARGAGAVGP